MKKLQQYCLFVIANPRNPARYRTRTLNPAPSLRVKRGSPCIFVVTNFGIVVFSVGACLSPNLGALMPFVQLIVEICYIHRTDIPFDKN